MILNKMRGAIGNIHEMMEFDREFNISIAKQFLIFYNV